MGSTGTFKPPHQSLRDFLRDELRYSNAPDAGLIDLATSGRGLAYAAIRHPRGFVFAATIQLRYPRHDPHENIIYRVDDETVGPIHTTCPQRILDQLTPDHEMVARYRQRPDGYWRAWRDACRAFNANRPARGPLPDGTIVRFEQPLRFTNGDEADTFVVRRTRTSARGHATRFHTLTRTPDGTNREQPVPYSISRWRQRRHHIIGHHT